MASPTTLKSKATGPVQGFLAHWKTMAVVLLAIFWGRVVGKALRDPISYMIPNALLFTPFRDLTDQMWDAVLQIDYSKEIEQRPIPEIKAEEFSFEKLREASSNWHYPVVVRGLFANTTAVQRWGEPGYVSERIGKYDVAVVQKAKPNKMDNERETKFERFEDAFHDVLTNPNTTKYIFFPLLSRFKTSKGEKQSYAQQMKDKEAIELKEHIKQMARDDLDLDRFWPGFGKPTHKNYIGAQFIAGLGKAEDSSGSNWHCAFGNNFFIQVVGKKRWEFLDQEYSSYMHPQRDGMGNLITGWKNAEEKQKYLPIKYCEVEAGDMIYNPDFEWHKITNHPGLSIGMPLRETNSTLAFQNNFQFASIVGLNHLMFHAFGIRYGLLQKG